jgi:hypothetical protein
MARKKVVAEPEDALLAALEKIVLDALQSKICPHCGQPELTAKDRMDILSRGTQLLFIRHKITPKEEEGSFFK